MKIYYSPRGKPLVFYGETDRPVLTVENCSLWYSVFLVEPYGKVVEISSNEVPGWSDHVPTPALMQELAEYFDAVLCPQSFEMVLGRYLRAKQGIRRAYEVLAPDRGEDR